MGFATDADLASRALDGDREALILLWDRNVDGVFSVCTRLLDDPRRCSRATTATFELAARRLATLGDPHDVTLWLLAVAAHQAATFRQHPGSRPSPPSALRRRPAWHGGDGSAGPATAAAELSPLDRLVLELGHRRRLVPGELARLLGTTPSSADDLLRSATAALDTSFGGRALLRRGLQFCDVLTRLAAREEDGPAGEPTSVRLARLDEHAARCGRCGALRERTRAQSLRAALPRPDLPGTLRDSVTVRAVLKPMPDSPRRARRGGWLADGFPPPLLELLAAQDAAAALDASVGATPPGRGGTPTAEPSSWTSLIAPHPASSGRAGRSGDDASWRSA